MSLADVNPSVIVAILSLIGVAVIWVCKKGFRGVQAFVHFVEIVIGKPAVGKSERVPGISERLANIEYELRTNSGGSLRDLVSETRTLAVQNAADARDAKAMAEQAATAAAEVAAMGAEAKRDMQAQAQALDGLLAGLSDFASEAHVKEVAVLRALKGIGIDLPEIVGDL